MKQRRHVRQQRQHDSAHRERAAIKAATQDASRVTPEGLELGRYLARLTEPVIAQLVREGEPDDRCVSCAFRAGTVPNGCPQTGMDAVKAVLEGTPFLCHLRLAPSRDCYGWYAARAALRGARVLCPWEFSSPA